MAKKAAVKEKYAGPKGPMKIETPPPSKNIVQKDVNFVGNELVKLTDRVNELELSIEEMSLKVKVVSGRMGL